MAAEVAWFQQLTIDSMLKELPSYDRQVQCATLGREVSRIFEGDPLIPGVLVMEQARFKGIVSRETFFEQTGKLFGTEVYLGRPIATMCETIRHTPLILPDTCLITLATRQALSRERASIYQPIVIETSGKDYRVLSALMLFIAQSQQLMALHQQRRFTVDAGQPISDEEALQRFLRFAKLNGAFDVARCFTRHAVRCDHCGQLVSYSVLDVVRTYPQLIRGISVDEGMGTRSYRFYVRHRCGKEIWEVPVQHDEQLEYRSQRTARLAESDV